VLLAFLGLPFGKKSEEEEKPVVKIMGDFKVQMSKADELFDDNKVRLAFKLIKQILNNF
jgi:hypothetical protein